MCEPLFPSFVEVVPIPKDAKKVIKPNQKPQNTHHLRHFCPEMRQIPCLNINSLFKYHIKYVAGGAIWKFLCSKEAFLLVVTAFSEE